VGIRVGGRLAALEVLARRAKHDLDSARRREAAGEITRLRALIDRLDVEIRAAGGPTTPVAAPVVAPKPKPKSQRRPRAYDVRRRLGTQPEPTLDLLNVLGVTAYDVKVWAVTTGRIPAVVRGRIKHDLVKAYAEAHPLTTPINEELRAP